MFRTRDFILFFTSAIFLVVAIGATILNQYKAKTVVTESVILAQVEDREYTSEIFVPESISRDERLSSMRQKIAEGGEFIISVPDPTVENEVTEESEEIIDTVPSTVQSCRGYKDFSGQWKVEGIKFELSEGVRIVYRENLFEFKQNTEVAASSTVPIPAPSRDILLQLPVIIYPSSNSSCLNSDVVGIAQDGSLIRNNEAGLYGVFGTNTVIGYALDGFPIYGVSNVSGDKCGGQTVNGQYGYYLSDKRDTIINCFSASPVTF